MIKLLVLMTLSLLAVHANLETMINGANTELRTSGRTSYATRSYTTTAYRPVSYTTYGGSYGYHAYGYSGYGYRSTTVVAGGGAAGGLICCCICICIIACIVCAVMGQNKSVDHDDGYGEVTETTTYTEVVPNAGPGAVQVAPPYPPAYPGGPTLPWCKNQHQMTWVQGNPYAQEADEGPVCDACNTKINYMQTFAHCYNCTDDLCLNCAPAQVR